MAPKVRRYFGVVHSRWELPFLLRLPPNAFLCWEPHEGVAAFAALARVGAVEWHRTTPLLTPEQAFGEHFRIEAEPQNALPVANYRMTAVIGGSEYLTTQLTGGENGGFAEVQAYSVANIWLCVRRRDEFEIDSLKLRTIAALNNVLMVHSFLIADGRSRPIRADLDSYYTVFSLAQVPDAWPQMTAEALLLRMNELRFQSEMRRPPVLSSTRL